jgi:hypothetical protein
MIPPQLLREAERLLRAIPDDDLADEIQLTVELGRSFPDGSMDREVCRETYRRLHQEQQRRRKQKQPSRRNRDGLTIIQRRERMHDSWPLDRFIQQVMGIPLDTRGNRLKCRCPWPGHDDKTPSFVIFSDGKGKCYGCGAYGDVFDLAEQFFGTHGFIETLERLEGMT